MGIQLFARFWCLPDGVWMKIERTQTGRTSAAKPVRATEQAAQAYGATGAGQAGGPPPAGDVATIAGPTEADLTPKVRQALDLLMTEVQRMLEELSQARNRINYLEKLADEDTLVPVANRRAFVREMSRMVAYAERYGAGSSVLYFDINGFKETTTATAMPPVTRRCARSWSCWPIMCASPTLSAASAATSSA